MTRQSVVNGWLRVTLITTAILTLQSALPVNLCSQNEVIVLLGDGHGDIASTVDNLDVTFTSSEGNTCSIDGRAVAADFNGDKVPDLFITADCPNDVVSFSGDRGHRRRNRPLHFP
jgi:hypothetical protein